MLLNKENTMKNPRQAFEEAISIGRLSRDEKASNYAGKYMYMGPNKENTLDTFKNTITREYIK